MRVYILFAIGLLSLVACQRSGTWEDDPANWERAFRSEKPKDVVVLHSQYWRSSHFTHEFQYFFEIQQNDNVRKQLFAKNKLTKLDNRKAVNAKQNYFGDAPKWFVPKSVDQYNIWVYENAVTGNFRLFIDKQTGNIFLTDHQT